MNSAAWFVVVGGLLLFMAITAARIKRLPLSTAIVYLTVGILLGPTFADQFHFNPIKYSALLEVMTEVAVLISLFGAGLKLAAPVGDRAWWIPFRLATVSMLLTVAGTTLVGVILLDLPLGAAVLLGAVLAPTDPVLASDVQVRGLEDDDELRFALTAEAGLNDGTAFPMVMLGLGLLGLHDLGEHFARWWLLDVVWATVCGFAVGGALGAAAGWALHRLNLRGLHSEFMEDFLGLGLLSLAYGATLLMSGYGFLAVFAAGFMLHRTETRLGDTLASHPQQTSVGTRPPAAHANMSEVSLLFVEQLERIGVVVLLLLVGGMLFADSWKWIYGGAAVALLCVVRPISVGLGLMGSSANFATQAAIGWFGVRGIGSLYYLMYAIQHGVDEAVSVTLISVVLIVITISAVLHGVTVTPLMRMYGARSGGM